LRWWSDWNGKGFNTENTEGAEKNPALRKMQTLMLAAMTIYFEKDPSPALLCALCVLRVRAFGVSR
jgi:hypothetical protein